MFIYTTVLMRFAIMKKEFIYSLKDIALGAKFILDNMMDFNIVLLDGDMGAGKTTMTKAICEEMRVTDTISSPTFSIVNEYRDSDNEPVYHFDFYRLEDVEEALNIGAEDYFYSGKKCFIEWGSRVENILPDEYILVSLEIESDNKRKIIISYER